MDLSSTLLYSSSGDIKGEIPARNDSQGSLEQEKVECVKATCFLLLLIGPSSPLSMQLTTKDERLFDCIKDNKVTKEARESVSEMVA